MKSDNHPFDINKVFSALSDGNRRKIIELLYEKDSTTLQLSEHFPISFQALSKHIKILENAQIISKKRQGKFRILSLNHAALKPTLQWISFFSDFWNESFDNLENIINQNLPHDHPE